MHKYILTYIHINIIHDIISAVEYNWGLNCFHHYRGHLSALDTSIYSLPRYLLVNNHQPKYEVPN